MDMKTTGQIIEAVGKGPTQEQIAEQRKRIEAQQAQQAAQREAQAVQVEEATRQLFCTVALQGLCGQAATDYEHGDMAADACDLGEAMFSEWTRRAKIRADERAEKKANAA